MSLHSALLNVMVQAVLKAARGIRRDFGEVEELQVTRKGPGDFVTASDRKAETVLREELLKARPGYGFLGEEGGELVGDDRTHRWIVDPIDGTTNYVHGIPHFAISVALEREGVLIAGLVYNPIQDELFLAERGKGAFLNDRRIRVAGRRDVSLAVIGCGMPHIGRGDHGTFRSELAEVQARFGGVRRFGSAALDLAWVAAGRLDGYWERHLKSWDMAAGLVLVREAGGVVSDLSGQQRMFETGSVIAGNDAMHSALRACMGTAG